MRVVLTGNPKTKGFRKITQRQISLRFSEEEWMEAEARNDRQQEVEGEEDRSFGGEAT